MKKRLNLEITWESNERLQKLMERAKIATITETIQQALAVFEFLIDETGKGNKLCLVDDDGNHTEVVMLGNRGPL